MQYRVIDNRHSGRRIYHTGSGTDMTQALRDHANEASPAHWANGVWTATDGTWTLDVDQCSGECKRVSQ